VSKESNNKDKKNQPKGYKQSSMKNVTCKRYFKHADVAEQLHCLLHVKEFKVAATELKRQIGD